MLYVTLMLWTERMDVRTTRKLQIIVGVLSSTQRITTTDAPTSFPELMEGGD